MEDILISAVSVLIGGLSVRLYDKWKHLLPWRPKQPDRAEVFRRYKAFKESQR